MAVLTAPDRAAVAAAVQRWWSAAREACAFTKPQLAAAVDATDAWIDANAASYNTALPAGFRTKGSALQKTLLFCYVAVKRARRDGAAVPMLGED